MCNHQYEINFSQHSKICYLQSVYEDYYSELGKLKLPVDSEGLCLFHSEDEDWKISNKFEVHLERVLDLMLTVPEFKTIDFRGVQFVSDNDKGIEWKDMTTTKTLNLCSTNFHTSLTMEHCHFGAEVFIDQANILGIWSLENSVFSSNFTAIQGTTFQSNVYIKDVIFHDLFDVQDARFSGQINMTDVTFNGFTQWNNAVFKSEKNAFSYFRFYIGKNANANFRNTEFHNIVQFEKCIFEGDTQFIETVFKEGVFITTPEIKANVSFRGKSEDERMFEDEIEMVIGSYSFEGAAQLILENANLTLLDKNTKNKLADLKAKRLVVLGEGTLVYRISFEESYLYSEINEIFIYDLLQTIRQYFRKRLNKHFEIILNKVGIDLVITFATDDYIKEADFYKDKEELTKELIEKMGLKVQDSVEHYLNHKFENQIINAAQNVLEKRISPEVIQQFFGQDNFKLILNSPKLSSINTNNLSIAEVNNSQFHIKKLENMENNPVFQLNESQFNELKRQLSSINDDEKWEELKLLLSSIHKDVVSQNELIPFLGDCGISIANNLSAGVLFIFLQQWLMR